MVSVLTQYHLEHSTPTGLHSAVYKGQRWVPGRTINEDVAVKVFRPAVSDAGVSHVDVSVRLILLSPPF